MFLQDKFLYLIVTKHKLTVCDVVFVSVLQTEVRRMYLTVLLRNIPSV
jgi:hypothetical protein